MTTFASRRPGPGTVRRLVGLSCLVAVLALAGCQVSHDAVTIDAASGSVVPDALPFIAPDTDRNAGTPEATDADLDPAASAVAPVTPVSTPAATGPVPTLVEAPPQPTATPVPSAPVPPVLVTAVPRPTATPSPTPTPGPSLARQVGDCTVLDDHGLVAPGSVPCTEPHDSELFGVFTYEHGPDVPHPGAQELHAQGEAACTPAFEAMFGIPPMTSVHVVAVIQPSETQWDAGERYLDCVVDFPNPVSTPVSELNPLRAFGFVSPFDFKVGECYGTLELTLQMQLVDCAAPHFHEVIAVTPLSTNFVSDSDRMAAANDICRAEYAARVSADRRNGELSLSMFAPTDAVISPSGPMLACYTTTQTTIQGSVLKG